ncbi:MAG: tyrosine-type recombinase/integrase, partial [Thermoplasmata archaeon]
MGDIGEYESYLRASGVKTWRARMGYLRRLREAYGKPLLELSASEINDWLVDLHINKPSRRTVVAYVKHCLRHLNAGEDPPALKGIGVVKNAKRSRVRRPEDLLTSAELRRFFDAFTDVDLRAYALLLYGTGARPGEILALRYSDTSIKEKAGKRYVQVEIPDSKTGAPRIALSAKRDVVKWVKTWLDSHGGKHEWLFPSPKGSGPRGHDSIFDAFKRAAKAAGIEKRIYPYLLRHQRATELYEAPAAIRDKAMGWITGSSQWSNYQHLNNDDL